MMRRIDYTTEWASKNIWSKGISTWNWWKSEAPLRWWCSLCNGQYPHFGKEYAPKGELEEVLKHIETEEHKQNLLLAKLGGESKYGYKWRKDE